MRRAELIPAGDKAIRCLAASSGISEYVLRALRVQPSIDSKALKVDIDMSVD
jgi:hypothetical protein